MNTARTITIIGADEKTNGAPITHEIPATYDTGTPVGRILAAMCDGGDTIENRQGLTRITIAADAGNRQPTPGHDELLPADTAVMQPAADDPPWTREQTLTNIRVRAEHRVNSRIAQPADAPAGDDMRRAMTQHRGGLERDRGNQ
ncbi:hypothetical protein G1C96_1305 [Bifidobacterium sp. DSM 109958]|uniref:Uncharacterized protein n=5 Tax=Bifidobacterium TaxID=1678 RepID=A0A087CTP4_9BIFI|nr:MULTISPECIES: hypothetical protein [Bifidobacterium]KAA8820142.1 hypothetical protein EMO90_06805 [Bifidobacterium vespertilionis]KAA8823932.1 hypothetical protein EM848_03845 [Bifidobacterium vespertilionis]KAA8824016.1 hypothetical protein EMO92_09030 [Bifidobacterium reuteri]KAA8832664.1 hypothetical protein EM849_03980 [Bifidobacterium tissieri]KFI56193.1 hypothetical protein BCAL_0564 [Bifidobacterium callitrichos DSM 23973]